MFLSTVSLHVEFQSCMLKYLAILLFSILYCHLRKLDLFLSESLISLSLLFEKKTHNCPSTYPSFHLFLRLLRRLDIDPHLSIKLGNGPIRLLYRIRPPHRFPHQPLPQGPPAKHIPRLHANHSSLPRLHRFRFRDHRTFV